MSPNNPEWFVNRFRKINEESGGCVFGRSDFGEIVSESKFGEFAYKMEPDGEIIAHFPERGVVACYTTDGKLGFASFELGSLLDILTDEELWEMPNHGDNILALLDLLSTQKSCLYLTVFPRLGIVKTEYTQESKTVSKNVLKDCNFETKYRGKVILDEIEIAFFIEKRSDEMVVAIGEQDKDSWRLISLSMSHHLDALKSLEGKDPNRFRKLAEKIILNG